MDVRDLRLNDVPDHQPGSDAVASTLPLGTTPLPGHQYETICHLVFASL